MATLKRTDSKTLKEPPPPPPRSCIACCDSEDEAGGLIRPCRECDTDFCVGCLVGTFESAVEDSTIMPPKCCSFLQIHTVINDLPPRTAKEYRERFEEWISPNKIYCPAPTCSAFLPERCVPKLPSTDDKHVSRLPSFLKDILKMVLESPAARFFRGEMDITQLPGYNDVVEHPIDLGKINANVARYDSINSLTLDMQLLVNNTRDYNGSGHPVSKAAEDLFKQYLRALSLSTQRMLETPPEVVQSTSTFACPKCHIAICTKCKQVEHGEAPCDTTASDEELAMLQSFGYKRCPRCKAGVKKMFGCSHMQCLCGAHYCWWCLRSIDDCDGTCSERADDDGEEEYYGEDEHGEPIVPGTAEHPTLPVRPATAPTAGANNPDVPENLDAGGYMRWAERVDLDFGDEPEEEPHMQVWSCKHRFSPYRIDKQDQFDRGDYLKMECNRCFAKVAPRKPSMSTRRRGSRMTNETERASSFGRWMRSIEEEARKEEKRDVAWECARCRVVTCEACKQKYEGELKSVDLV